MKKRTSKMQKLMSFLMIFVLLSIPLSTYAQDDNTGSSEPEGEVNSEALPPAETDNQRAGARTITISELFPDENLAKAVAENLGVSVNEEIELTILEETSVYLTVSEPVKSLAGIEFIPRLIWLSLDDASQLDTTTLSGTYGSVRNLQLYNYAGTDLEPLRHFPDAEIVYIRGNGQKISDISAVAALNCVDDLRLMNCGLTDISAFDKLNASNLSGLDIQDNNISDISVLSRFTNLYYLNVSDNNIKDISPIVEMSRMAELVLSNNPLSSITPILKLEELQFLSLSGTNLSDLSMFAQGKWDRLMDLELIDNNITDITPLKDLRLTYLSIDMNNISDISSLANHDLSYFTASYNKIENINVVKNWKYLYYLDLTGNRISNFSQLSGFGRDVIIMADNQEITLASQTVTGNSFSVKNVTVDKYGNAIAISNNTIKPAGSYNAAANTVTFTGITESSGTASYSFHVSYNGLDGPSQIIGGTVYAPYSENSSGGTGNTGSPSTTTSADSDLKGTIQGEIVQDSEFKVKVVSSGAEYDHIHKSLADKYEKLTVLDLNLYKEGVKVIFGDGDLVTVSIKLPDGYSSNSVIYRLEDDGTLTPLTSSVKDGYITFTTDHFSYYVIADGAAGNITTNGSTTISKNTPKTGDINTSVLWGLMMIICLGSVLVIYKKKTQA